MKWQSGICLFVLLAVALSYGCGRRRIVIESDPGMKVLATSHDAKFVLCVGAGIVRFDVNAKVIDKEDNSSRFVDLEGNLALDKESNVMAIYGAYRFSQKHSFDFGDFDIDRSSTLPRIFRKLRGPDCRQGVCRD